MRHKEEAIELFKTNQARKQLEFPYPVFITPTLLDELLELYLGKA
jgi:hypothetical protein